MAPEVEYRVGGGGDRDLLECDNDGHLDGDGVTEACGVAGAAQSVFDATAANVVEARERTCPGRWLLRLAMAGA